MKQYSAAECIDYILQNIEKRRVVNYADKNAVRCYNAAFDRIVKKANYLLEHYPDQVDMFMVLMNHPDYNVAATCISTLFGLRRATKEQRQTALASAKRLQTHPDTDELDRFVWKVNIKRWESELERED